MSVEKCACGGDYLDRFLQPVILSILTGEPCTGYAVIKRIPEYTTFSSGSPDPTGVYRYLKTGDLLSRSTREHLNNEHFETDPAGNRLDPARDTRFGHIKDNRLRHWQQYRYRYDAWGNVIERRSATQRQLFEYDNENRLCANRPAPSSL